MKTSRFSETQILGILKQAGHEWLDQYIIETIEEAQHHATQWLVLC